MRIVHISIVYLTLLGCKKQASELKVSNGRVVDSESALTKPVVKLLTDMGGPAPEHCTGTLLNASTVLTASHCVNPALPNGGVLLDDNDSALNAFTVPEFYSHYKTFVALKQQIAEASEKDKPPLISKAKAALAQSLLKDFAIVVFNPTDTKKFDVSQFYKVSSYKPKAEESIYVIGYGVKGYTTVSSNEMDTTDFGKKRDGLAIVETVGPGFATISGLSKEMPPGVKGPDVGLQVSIAAGDSGGPWIRCDPSRALGTECATFEVFAISQSGYNSILGAKGSGAILDSDIARALFRRAILCDRKPCAEYFPGSGVEDNRSTLDSAKQEAVGKKSYNYKIGFNFRDSPVDTNLVGKCLMVTIVTPGQAAYNAGIKVNDCIYSIRSAQMTSSGAYDKVIKSLSSEGASEATFSVLRNGTIRMNLQVSFAN